jgi:hypothetical protein
MANPFELPIILMQIIAALFKIFIAIFVLVIQLVPSNDSDEKDVLSNDSDKKN